MDNQVTKTTLIDDKGNKFNLIGIPEKIHVRKHIESLNNTIPALQSELSNKDKQIEELKENKVNENTSDGYHTFKELYEFRKIYNALLFNEWAKTNNIEVYKSKKHSDGEICFGGGWFIVVAILPTGQITNHYELKDWDLFKIEEYDKVKDKYDGHTPQDTVVRILDFINKVKENN